MIQGTILKALSGFYYIETEEGMLTCRARGKFRLDGTVPLVGDRVLIESSGGRQGTLKEVLPRKNWFVRPSVANLELMVIVASNAIPVTQPFLIDRIAAIAELKDCEPVICINKFDMDEADTLFEIYQKAGFRTIRTSAVTGEGIDALSAVIAGKICAFTGNSGVGKSSILNALQPDFGIETGEISKKLGRGRHTTRHVEMFKLDNGAIIADTPGFAAFDANENEVFTTEGLPNAFREFASYIGLCRFRDCAHVKEDGCAILKAVRNEEINPSRHHSYVLLYEQVIKAEKNKYN